MVQQALQKRKMSGTQKQLFEEIIKYFLIVILPCHSLNKIHYHIIIITLTILPTSRDKVLKA